MKDDRFIYDFEKMKNWGKKTQMFTTVPQQRAKLGNVYRQAADRKRTSCVHHETQMTEPDMFHICFEIVPLELPLVESTFH